MRFKRNVWIITLLLCGWASVLKADIPSPKVLRKQLVMALDRRTLTDSLYQALVAEPDKSPLMICYLGVVEALKAKHAWNPYYKLKYLNGSEKTLQTAVNREPNNIEIRFMRFSIEHNVPGFLGYNKHLTADRVKIIEQLDKKYYASADNDTVVTIIKFLINSKRCNAHEIAMLQKHLVSLK